MKQLIERLRKANEAYRAGSPIMSDAAYDLLEADLRSQVATSVVNTPDVVEAKKFLATVGAHPPKGSSWPKLQLPMIMGSLNKAQDMREFQDWVGSIQADPTTLLVVTEKLDGFSVGLEYDNGILVRAFTRGNGVVGEEITANVVKMKGVKLAYGDFTGFLRGEVVLRHSDWKAHFPEMTNPRNAAVGICKRLDGEGCEHLTVLHYAINPGTSHKEADMLLLEDNDFATPSWAALKPAGVEATYNAYISSTRKKLDYDIDGLVIEVNLHQTAMQLGELNNRPKGAIALKFPSDAKETTLLDVVWQVGNTGRITPVALFESVNLSGANVERASLHNIENIQALTENAGIDAAAGGLGLKRGARVLVSRRNDVNPYMEEVLSNGTGLEFRIPDTCPECKGPASRKGAYLRCENGLTCSAAVVGAISTWVKKIGVIGLGESFIKAVVAHGGVKDPADLYKLKAEDLQDIQVDGVRLGRKADLALEALHKVKELPLHVFVGSLGIELCSRSVCKMIVDAGYDTLDKMERATKADLLAVSGLGEAKADAFLYGLFHRMWLVDKLQDVGVSIKQNAVGALSGTSFCFTGFRDPGLESAIMSAGGNMKSSVGKGLTYLVVRDTSSTSAKADKARSMGTKIIDIAEAKNILGL